MKYLALVGELALKKIKLSQEIMRWNIKKQVWESLNKK
jgi:hypothetical protein